jgi:hypothetical protein
MIYKYAGVTGCAYVPYMKDSESVGLHKFPKAFLQSSKLDRGLFTKFD